jgi:hypothetical protein
LGCPTSQKAFRAITGAAPRRRDHSPTRPPAAQTIPGPPDGTMARTMLAAALLLAMVAGSYACLGCTVG